MNSGISMPATDSAAQKPARGLAWGIVALLWFAYLINYIDRQIAFSIFPVLHKELHFSDTQLGLVGSLFIWVYSLAMPFTGRIADVCRRDRAVVGSIALWSLATLGTGLSASTGGFLAWRAAMGVTEAFYMPAALALIADFHPGATRSKALAIHGTAQFAGIVAGGWFGGWMADSVGWRYGFILLAGAGLAYTVVMAGMFPRFPRRVSERKSGLSAPLAVLKSRCYLALTCAFFVFNFMLWMYYAWLPNWVHERYGLSLTQSGFTGSFYLQVSTVAGVLAGGGFGDWMALRVGPGRFYVAGAGLLLCSPFAWLSLASGSLTLFKLACAAFGLASGLMIANLYASAYDVVSEENYGFSAGALNFCGGLAVGTAVFLAGLWKQSVGLAILMKWAALAAAVGACFLLLVAASAFQSDRRRLASRASRWFHRAARFPGM